jgi:8-oxo-dGTP diphosphatase
MREFYKAFSKNLLDSKERADMISEAIKGIENVKLCDIELASNEVNYTHDTIMNLKKIYDHKFYYIIGSDVLDSLDKWRNINLLGKEVIFIVYPRKGYECNKELEGFNFINLKGEIDNISSSNIRARVSIGKSIKGLVPNCVEEYIMKKKLYKEEYEKPSVTADVLVIDKKNDSILLIKRKRDPYKDCWALPGGFLDVGKETVKETAKRELEEETCLKVKLKDVFLLGESSNPKRDPRGHIVSLHYVVFEFKGEACAKDDAKEVKFWPLDKLPKLAFDHKEMIKKYTKKF